MSQPYRFGRIYAVLNLLGSAFNAWLGLSMLLHGYIWVAVLTAVLTLLGCGTAIGLWRRQRYGFLSPESVHSYWDCRKYLRLVPAERVWSHPPHCGQPGFPLRDGNRLHVFLQAAERVFLADLTLHHAESIGKTSFTIASRGIASCY